MLGVRTCRGDDGCNACRASIGDCGCNACRSGGGDAVSLARLARSSPASLPLPRRPLSSPTSLARFMAVACSSLILLAFANDTVFCRRRAGRAESRAAARTGRGKALRTVVREDGKAARARAGQEPPNSHKSWCQHAP